MKRIHFYCLICLTLLIFSGCRPSYQRETAPVRGCVTVDGTSLTSGYVIVIPRSGRMAKGTIQSDGSFVMGTYTANDGVPIGKHTVVVQPVPADAVDHSKLLPGPSIPNRYSIASTSGLEIEVTPDGIADFRVDLQSN